jgi:1-acyl-sn-glycerol-3-phosphate acyltransferase
MPTIPSSPTPKPVSAVWQPELTRLPGLTPGRRFVRRLAKFVCRAAVTVCTRATVRGLENYPRRGPALVVINHLGDPDVVLALALLPDFPELIGKIELREIGWLRRVTDMLGVIWVHRGQPDRRALSAALDALRQGRRVLIAPEGRESLTGRLEEGEAGAAFLALRSGAPVVPVTLTGSENRRIEDGIQQKRRTPVTLTVGRPFVLSPGEDRHEALRAGTRLIMETLARQLPAEYRGVYSYVKGDGE